jgi:uncharacterized protein YndB with AHSA1/START domain
MKNDREDKTTERKTDITIELAASADAMWKAMTDPGELARWFPMTARVKPRVGGSIWLSWGPGCEGEAPITAWEPGRHFQWQENATNADGSVDPHRKLIIDLTLEASIGGSYTGQVKFVTPPRGFCVTVESLNDALFWVTIEGAPGKHELQIWLSAYDLPAGAIEGFEAAWSKRLDEMFA